MMAEDESVGFFRATTEVSEFDALPYVQAACESQKLGFPRS